MSDASSMGSREDTVQDRGRGHRQRASVSGMRILLIVNGTDFGGTEVTVSRIAVTLRKRGHDVCVLSLKRLGPVGKQIAQAGIAVSSLEMNESVALRDLVRGTAVLGQWLRRQDVDVIHSFLPRASVMSRIANRLSGARRPHIANEESTDFRRPRLVRMLNRMTARWSERIVTVSAAVRDVLASRDGLPSQKIVVVPIGVDLDAIDQQRETDIRTGLKLAPSTAVLCAIGRLTRVKGHVYLIRALARLASEVADVHLVLVGDGPEDRRLRSEANAQGVESRVRFLGSRADAVGIMKGADVFVLPSLQEGLPVVLLEAMACSLPIVASNVGGVGELIQHGETGLLVAPAEMWNRRASLREEPPLSADEGVAALTRAVSALLRDRRQARLLGGNARRLVESSHTIEQQVASLEQLYAALVDGSNGGASANLTRGIEPLQQREAVHAV